MGDSDGRGPGRGDCAVEAVGVGDAFALWGCAATAVTSVIAPKQAMINPKTMSFTLRLRSRVQECKKS